MEKITFYIYKGGINKKMIVTDDIRYKSLNTVLFPNALLYFHMNRILRKIIGDGKLAVFVPGN